MSTEAYKELLKRYLDGKCTDEEEKLIEEWYNNLHVSSVKLEDLNSAEIDNKLWTTIDNAIKIEKPKVRTFKFYKIAIAASLLIAALFYYNSTQLVPLTYTFDNDKVSMINNNQEIEEVKLVDGTFIQLYPKSSITYSKSFSEKKREVYLKGKAFFQVAKNKEKPFVVHNYHNTIHVVGTSFLVQSENDPAQNYIEVVSGKVWVEENNTLFERKNNTKYVLTPNKKLAFDSNQNKFTEGIVSSPKPMAKDMEHASGEVSFSFSDTPLENVVGKLEQVYGLNIELDNQNLSSCTFTGNLNDEDLFKKLDLLCTSIGAKYSVKHTNIYISGNGCR
ncbi:anti-FecI sigma factor, FecR [Pseudopedobacter saltans DSM 12145]|uniref:Anti-FecI sigma factor, FecR n=1 Tax=Pseudopedobacter saltans (strain ATCC 51119 / DSM 12145 / JCM 21818 / CCUG 39354 / LMG 10337 / NBRC 100064 / NCIMB 13643) TaxID=762903 RepID=F0SBH8_PSESL|nr:FecR family protein [Pseudopedobacter saltans]ADY51624.1 anti-FecI sigma factor, FecR [Pseudopedobacter saltans DSM 12145]